MRQERDTLDPFLSKVQSIRHARGNSLPRMWHFVSVLGCSKTDSSRLQELQTLIPAGPASRTRNFVCPRALPARYTVYSPQAMSSGDTRPERSGSSPYQKIQSSLAALRESGGGAGEGAMPRSKMPAPGAEAAAAAAAGPLEAGVPATRRHTHKMSPARHREKLDSTGSSRGVPPNPPATSPQTSFLHLIPQRDVCKTISQQLVIGPTWKQRKMTRVVVCNLNIDR